jgi:hypothetical protein
MEEEKTRAENLKDATKDLTEHVADFLETYLRLISIKLAQKSISVVSSLINFAAIAILCFFVFLFVSFGLAWWLGTLVNNRAGGFFIVGGIYLLCMIILIAIKNKIIFPYLRNVITRMIYE